MMIYSCLESEIRTSCRIYGNKNPVPVPSISHASLSNPLKVKLQAQNWPSLGEEWNNFRIVEIVLIYLWVIFPR